MILSNYKVNEIYYTKYDYGDETNFEGIIKIINTPSSRLPRLYQCMIIKTFSTSITTQEKLRPGHTFWLEEKNFTKMVNKEKHPEYWL